MAYGVKTGGRQKGSLNRRTIAYGHEVRAELAALNCNVTRELYNTIQMDKIGPAERARIRVYLTWQPLLEASSLPLDAMEDSFDLPSDAAPGPAHPFLRRDQAHRQRMTSKLPPSALTTPYLAHLGLMVELEQDLLNAADRARTEFAHNGLASRDNGAAYLNAWRDAYTLLHKMAKRIFAYSHSDHERTNQEIRNRLSLALKILEANRAPGQWADLGAAEAEAEPAPAQPVETAAETVPDTIQVSKSAKSAAPPPLTLVEPVPRQPAMPATPPIPPAAPAKSSFRDNLRPG